MTPAPDDEVLDLSMPAGHTRLTTWGEVEVGHIVRDQKDRLHTVIHAESAAVTLRAARTNDVVRMVRPADDRPVTIYVPSEREMLNLLHAELGATVLRDIEDRERTLRKASMWRLDPVPRSAVPLRDHIDMVHGNTYVDHLMSRASTADQEAKAATAAKNPEMKKKAAAKKKASLDELAKIHDELHADPAAWPMSYPHHHGGTT